MNINQIQNISSVMPDMSIDSLQSAQVDNTKTFSDWLVDQSSELNQLAINSEEAVKEISSGEVDNLHQIILGMEKAKLSFDLAVQVRDKLLEGYNKILRMQV
jgi:flagellar hook-basal body complex protein FliE